MLKKKHFNGGLIQDLMRGICLREILTPPQKNELLCSNEQVSDGQMFYFVPRYHKALMTSIREAVYQGSLQNMTTEERSLALLQAMEDCIDVSEDDLKGIELTTHFIAR